MSRLAWLSLGAIAGVLAGGLGMLLIVDRLFGGGGPRIRCG